MADNILKEGTQDQQDNEPDVVEITDPEQLEAAAQIGQQVSELEETTGKALAGVSVIDLTADTDPNVFNDRPNGEHSIAGILLHHTGSANESGDIFWLSRWHENPVSTHKVIKRNGTIVKLVPEDKRAWHAGASIWHNMTDCNDTMIGYEICNRGDGEAFTQAQYESIAQSIAYDCARYRIPDADVTTHREVRNEYLKKHPGGASPKNDPFHFDLTKLWQLIAEVRQDWPFAPEVPFWRG